MSGEKIQSGSGEIGKDTNATRAAYWDEVLNANNRGEQRLRNFGADRQSADKPSQTKDGAPEAWSSNKIPLEDLEALPGYHRFPRGFNGEIIPDGEIASSVAESSKMNTKEQNTIKPSQTKDGAPEAWSSNKIPLEDLEALPGYHRFPRGFNGEIIPDGEIASSVAESSKMNTKEQNTIKPSQTLRTTEQGTQTPVGQATSTRFSEEEWYRPNELAQSASGRGNPNNSINNDRAEVTPPKPDQAQREERPAQTLNDAFSDELEQSYADWVWERREAERPKTAGEILDEGVKERAERRAHREELLAQALKDKTILSWEDALKNGIVSRADMDEKEYHEMCIECVAKREEAANAQQKADEASEALANANKSLNEFYKKFPFFGSAEEDETAGETEDGEEAKDSDESNGGRSSGRDDGRSPDGDDNGGGNGGETGNGDGGREGDGNTGDNGGNGEADGNSSSSDGSAAEQANAEAAGESAKTFNVREAVQQVENMVAQYKNDYKYAIINPDIDKSGLITTEKIKEAISSLESVDMSGMSAEEQKLLTDSAIHFRSLITFVKAEADIPVRREQVSNLSNELNKQREQLERWNKRSKFGKLMHGILKWGKGPYSADEANALETAIKDNDDRFVYATDMLKEAEKAYRHLGGDPDSIVRRTADGEGQTIDTTA